LPAGPSNLKKTRQNAAGEGHANESLGFQLCPRNQRCERFGVARCARDKAKVLSGGQSLMPAMNLRLISPELIVDIGEIAELRGIAVSGDVLTIGALTRHVDLARSPEIATHATIQAGSSRGPHAQGCHRGFPLRMRCATCASASSAEGRAWQFRAILRDQHGGSAPDVRTSPLTAIPRSSAISPMSTISSGEIKRRFIAGIRLWPPRAPSPCPVRNEQLQSVHNAGCAGIAESRGFHWRDLPQPHFGAFS